MVNKSEPSYSRPTFLVIFGLVIFLSYKIAASFLVAVLMGGLIAHALKPIQEKRLFKRMKPVHAAYVIFIGLILVVVFPLALFISSLIRQATQFKDYLSLHEVDSLQSLIQTIGEWPIASYFIEDPVKLKSQLEVWTTDIGSSISSVAVAQAAQIPSLFVQTIIILLSCLVFLIEGKRFTAWLSDKIPLKAEIKDSILHSFGQSSKIAVWASLTASGAQTLVILTGFLVLNIPAAVFAAGATFIFSFVPILGASPVWILGAIYLYLQGSIIKVVLMIAFGICAGLIDNVARALVLKGPNGLHPLVGLIAVFGGLQVFGLFGVLIGPIVIALLITMCEVWPQVWK